MPTTPEHAREFLHSRGVTDEQILAVQAITDQHGAWVRQAAHLAQQIRANIDRGDQEGMVEGRVYMDLLNDHLQELDAPRGGMAWAILHLLLSQASVLARDLGGAETRLRELADLVAAEPHGPYCKPWRLEQWPDDPAGCVCVKGRLTAVIERKEQR